VAGVGVYASSIGGAVWLEGGAGGVSGGAGGSVTTSRMLPRSGQPDPIGVAWQESARRPSLSQVSRCGRMCAGRFIESSVCAVVLVEPVVGLDTG